MNQILNFVCNRSMWTWESQVKIPVNWCRIRRYFNSDTDSRLELIEKRVRLGKLLYSWERWKENPIMTWHKIKKYLLLFNFAESLMSGISSFRNIMYVIQFKTSWTLKYDCLDICENTWQIELSHYWYNWCCLGVMVYARGTGSCCPLLRKMLLD